MMKTINIKGVPFTYKEEYLTYENTHPITQEDGKKLLEKTKILFDSIGLNFYLTFGTLLGAVRDKAIIKGDEDIDIFTDNEDLLVSNLPYLWNNNLKIIRIVKGILYSFRMDETTYIDVYILRPLSKYNIWSIYCLSLSNYITPKKYFKEYQEIEFLGKTYKCPRNPEKLLAFWYGKDWRIPQKGHHFIYEVKSAYYFHRLILHAKNLIKRCICWNQWKHKVKRDIHEK